MERPAEVVLIENAVDESAGGLPAYRIDTPRATYFLEKTGGGLSSLVDREGRDWLGFEPTPGSGAAGEFRGFPNAVNRQAGNYFHAKNAGTDPCVTRVEAAARDRVVISVASESGHWAGRYEFRPTHCTFTMTRMPAEMRYWVLYEGTPGGSFEPTDWWLTATVSERQPMGTKFDGDLPAPEWIAFGDAALDRALVLAHHEDDAHPDAFYAMDGRMTVFGFGRLKGQKFLDSVPQSVSIGLVEPANREAIDRWVAQCSIPDARSIRDASP